MVDFKEAELAGWHRKAANYDDHFARVTARSIPAFLDGAGDVAGLDVLDVCCGTGDLANAFARAGARVSGSDFAEPMVNIAQSKYPDVTFAPGDAEALEYPDDSFDLITCAFGLWHLADPDKAVAEAARILRPGGRYIYSAWVEQTENHQAMFLITDAVKRLGRLDVDIPPAPPPYRFATHDTATAALTAQGFTKIDLRHQSVDWVGTSGQQLLDLIMKSIVRAPMLIDAQSADARRAIMDDIVQNAQALKRAGKITMDWPYMLAVASTRSHAV